MLADYQIRHKHMIEPFREAQLQPASYDLRLGLRILAPVPQQVNLGVAKGCINTPSYTELWLPYVLEPGEFILAHTEETLTLPNDIAGKFEGKSSLGRLGLMTHITAGFIDPGFCGNLDIGDKERWAA